MADFKLYGGASMTAAEVDLSADKIALRDASETGNARHKWMLMSQMQLVFNNAELLRGAFLAPNVLSSSLTSVGVLDSLTVTASINGSVTGSATFLKTARNINGVAFDGTSDITITANGATLTGSTLASNITSSSLTSVGVLGNLTVTNPISGSINGNAGSATVLQTSRTINGVSFNGSSNITVTANAVTLTGTSLAANVVSSSLTSVGTLGDLTVTNLISGSINGNAATATALQTSRTINNIAFNGTSNITIPYITPASSTWALRPAANSVANGTTMIFTDIGENGSMWVSNSATNEWHPVNGRVMLYQTGVAAVSSNSISEQVLRTVTIPAAIMGSNGQIIFSATYSFNNNANAKEIKARFGGVSGVLYINNNRSNSTLLAISQGISNRNNTTLQISTGSGDGNNSGTLISSNINTNSAVDLVFSVQKAVGTDTATLERLTVEITYP